jgi:hypothetical protein
LGDRGKTQKGKSEIRGRYIEGDIERDLGEIKREGERRIAGAI